MRRREFIVSLCGAIGSASSARTQASSLKRVAVLTGLSEDNATAGSIEELRRALEARGWHEGRNLEVVYRFAGGDPDQVQRYATELVRLQPDVVVAHTAVVVAAIQKARHTLSVVFVSIPDPVADGFVASLARPGGNLTGFTNYDFTIGAKWLQILKEIAPKTQRVGVLLNTDAEASYSSYAGYWRSVEPGAESISVTAKLSPVHNHDEIENAIAMVAGEPNGGLIVPVSAPITAYIGQIIETAARHRLPAIYGFGSYVRQGGLVAYGTSLGDLFRRAAEYVDRILKGDKPEDLPVQGPTKFELVINLKTAHALGLSVPQTLLARADQVIE